MKRVLMSLMTIWALVACSGNTQKDETSPKSESVTTQTSVIRAFGMNPPLTVLLEILNPEGMIGLNYKPYPEDIIFMPPHIADLPVLGHMGNKSALFELIVSLKPDVLFFSDSTPIEMIEPYEKVGIKSVRVKGYGFDDLSEAIEAYKDAMSADFAVRKKADMLLEFVKKSSIKLQTLSALIASRPKIYFAQGFDGLSSQCGNENDSQELAYKIGGVNALLCSMLNNPTHQVNINFEILASINPDIIFIRELPLYKELMANPPNEWSSLKAFENHQVYYAPSTPSNWLMRPPSVMQVLGFLWAFAKVQPTLLGEDEVKEEVQTFFQTFLRDLSDEDYERIQGLRD